ncbi:MAG: DUF3786 domain-containing protein [Proteobacteria bacterium]|nr:DUF3786 domain-containing protein [Pseudomonadota bacterium]
MSNNQKDERATHALYWEELAKAEPEEVCHRTGAIYSQERKGYFLPLLNQKYLILPVEQKILCLRGDVCEEEELRDYFYLMVLLYLLEAKGVEPTSTWISEKELKGGTTFFRGPHALRVEELKTAFGKNPEAFGRAGNRLGGVDLLFGDKAFSLTVFPKVPLAYVLWKEDEEFPARVTVMFDSTIQNHFSLDGIWCLVAEVSQRLLDAQEP